jgi:hypothetical protein
VPGNTVATLLLAMEEVVSEEALGCGERACVDIFCLFTPVTFGLVLYFHE